MSGTHTTGFEFLVESVLVAQRQRLAIAEAPIMFVGREAGHSKLTRGSVLAFLRFLIRESISVVSQGGDSIRAKTSGPQWDSLDFRVAPDDLNRES